MITCLTSCSWLNPLREKSLLKIRGGHSGNKIHDASSCSLPYLKQRRKPSGKEVRDMTADWLHRYNYHRPHESLGRVPPVEYRIKQFPNLYY
ncbi:MAG: integrase core domain-containing protein [Hydrogenophaga sp.]|uniref:integrase core domain-containing protein n=1 Tax=unclassified Hydrogenophaga TaxID=2610897 RepID=UPI0010F5BC3E